MASPSSVALVSVFEPNRQREEADRPRLQPGAARGSSGSSTGKDAEDSVIIITKPGAPDGSCGSASATRRARTSWTSRPRSPSATRARSGSAATTTTAATTYGPVALLLGSLDLRHETPDGLESHLDMLHSSSFCKASRTSRPTSTGSSTATTRRSTDTTSPTITAPATTTTPTARSTAMPPAWRGARGRGHVEAYLLQRQGRGTSTSSPTPNHKRLLKLDPTSSVPGASFDGQEASPGCTRHMDGATLSEFPSPGDARDPERHLEVHEGLVYVTRSRDRRDLCLRHPRGGWSAHPGHQACPRARLAGITFGPGRQALPRRHAGEAGSTASRSHPLGRPIARGAFARRP